MTEKLKRKPGLTLEQHMELGAKLREVNNVLTKEYVSVSNAYPLNHKAVVAMKKAMISVGQARSLLDETVFKEHRSQVVLHEKALSAYYGPPLSEREPQQ